MKALIPLTEVLSKPETFDWQFGLFLPKQPWALQTQCAVLDSQYEENPEPELTEQYSLVEALNMHTVQQIIENLEQQVVRPTLGQRLIALQFYYTHDAFIDLASVAQQGIQPDGPASGRAAG